MMEDNKGSLEDTVNTMFERFADLIRADERAKASTWQGLTDEEILQTLDLVAYDPQAFDFAYRIEAKLKEKNT